MILYETITNGEIDNRLLTLDQLKDKFEEETSEVVEAIQEYIKNPNDNNLKNLFGEMFDVVQVLTVVNSKLDVSLETLQNYYEDHLLKLLDRDWIMEPAFFIKKY